MGALGNIARDDAFSELSIIDPRARTAAQAKQLQIARFGRGIKARFDSQFTTDENRRHWQLADSMSVDAAASWQVRRTLRMRSRYEYHNNGYYMNLVGNIGNYEIGIGPRLQMLTKNPALNQAVEDLFRTWAKEIKLGTTLKTMREARCYNGESFAILRTNPGLEHPIKLDVFEVEADQVSSPLFGMYPANYPDQFFDGVVLDPWGRPQTYHILRQHPGAFGAFVIMGYEFDPYPARYVLHDYKRVRPGQQRGIPETLPVLPLFAQLRRYRLAVLGAAETAADYAAVLQSEAAATDESGSTVPFDTVELEPRMATVLPGGWKLSQLHAEQPTANFDMFCDSILSEIACNQHVPLFFLTLDARKANMSSAYVVTQPFAKSVTANREVYNGFLDRILKEFIAEAMRIEGVLPEDRPEDLNQFTHTWRWPLIGTHADPAKTASAQSIRLESGTSSIPHEAAEAGLDWEELQQADAASLGMSLDEYRAALRTKRFAVSTRGGAPASPSQSEPEPMPSGDEPPPEE